MLVIKTWEEKKVKLLFKIYFVTGTIILFKLGMLFLSFVVKRGKTTFIKKLEFCTHCLLCYHLKTSFFGRRGAWEKFYQTFIDTFIFTIAIFYNVRKYFINVMHIFPYKKMLIFFYLSDFFCILQLHLKVN